jgi:DNA processing protein
MKKVNTEKKILTYLSSIKGFGRVFILKMKKWSQDRGIELEEFIKNPSLLTNFSKSIKNLDNLREFKKKFGVDDYWEYLGNKNIRVLTYQDFDYPQLLKEINDFPLILFVKGVIDFPTTSPLAMVGTRKVTNYGRVALSKLFYDLRNENFHYISGFMYGVDTLVAKQALKYRKNTIGVLGFGFDHMYPSSNQNFFQEVLERGSGFVSEYPPFQPAFPSNFILRNRIVAGMSLGTVVIEGAKKSGSLITANFANEYGREVFSVAGPITNPYSEGTKELVNQGAKLISSGEDIVSELLIYLHKSNENNHSLNKSRNFGSFEKKILGLLKAEILTIDQILAKLSIPISAFNSILTKMEMEGLVVIRGDCVLLNYFDEIE